MAQITAICLFFIGIGGISYFVFAKAPVLAEFAFNREEKPGFFKKMRERVKIKKIFSFFPSEILLQKILSSIRVFTLRIENKTGCWLEKLRKNALEKKNFSSDYWQKIKQRKRNRE